MKRLDRRLQLGQRSLPVSEQRDERCGDGDEGEDAGDCRAGTDRSQGGEGGGDGRDDDADDSLRLDDEVRQPMARRTTVHPGPDAAVQADVVVMHGQYDERPSSH